MTGVPRHPQSEGLVLLRLLLLRLLLLLLLLGVGGDAPPRLWRPARPTGGFPQPLVKPPPCLAPPPCRHQLLVLRGGELHSRPPPQLGGWCPSRQQAGRALSAGRACRPSPWPTRPTRRR